MLRFAKLADKPHVFHQLADFLLQAFADLLPAFERAEAFQHEQQDQQRSCSRQHKPGGDHKLLTTTSADRFLFILFYFKIYLIQDFQTFFFGLSQAQAWE